MENEHDIQKAHAEESSNQPAQAVNQSEKPIKSRNKAAGLKSTLLAGRSIYLTSFGRGNEAIAEHQIQVDADYRVTSMTDHCKLTTHCILPNLILNIKPAMITLG